MALLTVNFFAYIASIILWTISTEICSTQNHDWNYLPFPSLYSNWHWVQSSYLPCSVSKRSYSRLPAQWLPARRKVRKRTLWLAVSTSCWSWRNWPYWQSWLAWSRCYGCCYSRKCGCLRLPESKSSKSEMLLQVIIWLKVKQGVHVPHVKTSLTSIQTGECFKFQEQRVIASCWVLS